MKPEIWKKFLNNYAVSSWGRFYNLKTKKFMNGYLHKSRTGIYRRIQFGKIRLMAHVVVAYKFKAPVWVILEFNTIEKFSKTKKWIVNHEDGNTLNNNENNVEIITQSENVSHWHKLRKGPDLCLD